MKKIKILGIFIILILSVISHFMFDFFPNSVFSVLFPVNESIWEHMKLIITPGLIFSLIEYYIYRYKNINYKNFILSYAISTIIGIISYLILYLPIHYIYGHSLLVAVILLLVIFIMIEVISYYIMNYREIKYSNIIGISLLIVLYIIFGYLTYKPLIIDLFYDSIKKDYGIIKD